MVLQVLGVTNESEITSNKEHFDFCSVTTDEGAASGAHAGASAVHPGGVEECTCVCVCVCVCVYVCVCVCACGYDHVLTTSTPSCRDLRFDTGVDGALERAAKTPLPAYRPSHTAVATARPEEVEEVRVRVCVCVCENARACVCPCLVDTKRLTQHTHTYTHTQTTHKRRTNTHTNTHTHAQALLKLLPHAQTRRPFFESYHEHGDGKCALLRWLSLAAGPESGGSGFEVHLVNQFNKREGGMPVAETKVRAARAQTDTHARVGRHVRTRSTHTHTHTYT